MEKGIMRVKAKVNGDMTVVKMMAKHPMHSGRHTDEKTGEVIPAQYLQTLTVVHKERTVFAANMGAAMSKNPFFAFNFVGGEKGDELSMTWLENTGKTATEVVKLK